MSTNGLIIKISQQDFETTYQKLKGVLENNPNLKIMLELNHQANAAAAGLTLLPTKIILFGNPKLGTPLMQSSQTVAIDLPQKIIVYQDAAGSVNVAYNDPLYLKERHGISEKEEVLGKIAGALDKITTIATTK